MKYMYIVHIVWSHTFTLLVQYLCTFTSAHYTNMYIMYMYQQNKQKTSIKKCCSYCFHLIFCLSEYHEYI